MKLSQIASGVLSWTLAISVSGIGTALPAFADDSLTPVLNSQVSQGDTASAKPGVGAICQALDNARNGKFVAANGDPLNGLDPTCAAQYVYRADQAKYCTKPLTQILGATGNTLNKEDADALCAGQKGKISKTVETYCTLRTIAASSQAMQYCEAWNSADKAQSGVRRTLGFDIGAAGICFGEYAAMKMSQGSNYKGFACGGAAMAASMMELVQTASILKKYKDKYDDKTASGNSAGAYKVDDSNNVVNRGALGKALEITASSTLSASAFMIGVCYYNKDKSGGLCDKFASADQRKDAVDSKSKALAEKQGGQAGAMAGYSAYMQGKNATGIMADYATAKSNKIDQLSKSNRNDVNQQMANEQLALKAGLVFTALAGIRGISLASAASVKSKVQDLLQSMFDPSNNTTTMSPTGLGTSSLPNLFASTANNYNATNNNGGNKSAVTASPNPDDSAFLAPPGGPLANQAQSLAAKLPSSAIDSAGSGSGAGLGGAITSAAMAAGVKDSDLLNQIRGQANSIFANLPKEEGGYNGGGGGGRGLASKKDTGDGLNLKSLFGGGEAEEKSAAGRTDVAFQGMGKADDIWHSQNPRGNNLFQIISDQYDNVQRKSSVGPGI